MSIQHLEKGKLWGEVFIGLALKTQVISGEDFKGMNGQKLVNEQKVVTLNYLQVGDGLRAGFLNELS